MEIDKIDQNPADCIIIKLIKVLTMSSHPNQIQTEKVEDGLLNWFISQQIQVVLRGSFCKSSLVNKSNLFLNYFLRNIIFIESWPNSSGRHGTNHWERVETEKVCIKCAFLEDPIIEMFR